MFCAWCGESIAGDACQWCDHDPLLGGRYRLETVLGRGAVGTTWKAVDAQTGDACAVKEVPLRRLAEDKDRELLHREAAVLRQLRHPAIPRGLDDLTYGEGKGRSFYIVQEFIEGRDLQAEMVERRYTPGEVLDIADELLGVLEYLHGLSPPVIHRDIKPKNVMRRTASGEGGSLALVDFGSVRDTLKGRLGGSTVAGTFGYMAPEQFMGDADARTDLYGIGALMLALLTRKDPQEMMGPKGLEWLEHVQVAGPLLEVLTKLLAREPAQRYPDAATARAAVRHARLHLDAPIARAPRKASVLSLAMLAGLGSTMLLAAVFLVFVTTDESAPVEETTLAAEVAVPRPPEPVAAVEVPEIPSVADETPAAAPDRVDVGHGSYPPLGQTGAPVAIVVFSDFQCPYCAKLTNTLEEVRTKYGDQVSLWFRDFPLKMHANAHDAHRAARCADEQHLFWPMHDQLFDNHRALERDNLFTYAGRADLFDSYFRSCMASERGEAEIAADIADGKVAGVTGTPHSFVNGVSVRGAQSAEAFMKVIDAELAR